MRLELYEAECQRIAADCEAMLTEASRRLAADSQSLTALEQAGTLHALQVLIENAIRQSQTRVESLFQQTARRLGAFESSAYAAVSPSYLLRYIAPPNDSIAL